MPLFDNEFTFIHIPKCGGTSIETFMVDNGYKMSLHTFTGSIFINGHTPQHCTFAELEELNILTEKVFTIVRPNYDRVISEYFYILEKRKDLKKLFRNFNEFLNLFLDKKNLLLFDNHNLPTEKFLTNKNGVIDQRIKIFNFFDINEIENYLGITGLSKYHELKSNKKPINLTKEQMKKIDNYYF